MASRNLVILIGNLGKDPELRTTQGGKTVANFSLATTEKYKDQEKTEWHNIQAWGRLAEICGEYLHKGSQVYIEGKIQTRAWEDKSGNKRYTTEIVAHQLVMLGGKRSEGGGSSTGGHAPAEEPISIPDDDIPF